jgi:hypothetical protein
VQSLCQKLEFSARALCEASEIQVEGLTYATGLIQQVKTLPRLTVAASSGPEFPQDSGNFTVQLSAEFRSNADDTTEQEHASYSELALAPLMSDELATELSEHGDEFTVFGISNRQANHGVEERSFVSTLTMDVYSCGTEFS